MRHRVPSDDILFRRRSNKSSRTGRRRKRRPADWNIVAKLWRSFTPGKSVVEAPIFLDLFDEDLSGWTAFFSRLSRPPSHDVVVDLSKVQFIYPEAVVYFACICDHLLRKSNAIIREDPPKLETIDDYLDIAGLRNFFEAKRPERKTTDPQLFGDCIPISRDLAEKASSANKMAELLVSQATRLQNKTFSMSEAFGEVMGNAIEHGEVREWYRIGQIHPTRRQLSVAIADNGVGIPHTLRNGYNNDRFRKLKDSEIIRRSLDSDVTRFVPKVGENHGYGLTRAVELAKVCDAQLAILSGRGLCRITYRGGEPISEEFRDFKTTLPGTLIALRIPL